MRYTVLCIAVTVGLALSCTNTALAEDSEESALKARKMWTAFACSALASKFNNAKEEERLFLYGYKQGQEFLSAVIDERIRPEDIQANVPASVILRMQGPTTEFILGRIWEAAVNDTLDAVLGSPNDTSAEAANIRANSEYYANNAYHNENCELIGK